MDDGSIDDDGRPRHPAPDVRELLRYAAWLVEMGDAHAAGEVVAIAVRLSRREVA
jgi:hypothetical protein